MEESYAHHFVLQMLSLHVLLSKADRAIGFPGVEQRQVQNL